MTAWWITMGCLVAAALALVPNYVHRRQRRAQVAHVRAQVESWLSAPQSPAGGTVTPRISSADRAPAAGQCPLPPDRGTDRCCPTVVSGAPDLGTTVAALGEAS